MSRPAVMTLATRWQTWWTILRISAAERMAYRGDFVMGTLMRFLPIVTQIFLWHAIFAAKGSEAIVGYRYEDFVAYYLLTMVTRAFSSMPGLASSIGRMILSGEIKKFLIQPVDLLGFLFISRVAHKLAYYLVAIGPFALVFFLCRGYFQTLPDGPTWMAFIVSLFCSFVLGYYLEACMGLVGFWFGEIASLLFVYMLFSFFLSGHMFPIDMLEGSWRQIVMYTPLIYLAYFPAAVFLGKITGAAMWWGLAIEIGWTCFFIVLSRVMFYYGVRRYSAYGG
jgi:ABC-2 type transport system permease protein